MWLLEKKLRKKTIDGLSEKRKDARRKFDCDFEKTQRLTIIVSNRQDGRLFWFRFRVYQVLILKNSLVQQEVLTRLLVEKGIFTKEEFGEMVRVMDREMKREENRRTKMTEGK